MKNRKLKMWSLSALLLLVAPGLSADWWVQMPSDTPEDWILKLPDYALTPVPGYFLEGQKSYKVHDVDPEEIDVDDELKNYRKQKKDPKRAIPYDPIKVCDSMRYARNYKPQKIIVADFYAEGCPWNSFGLQKGAISPPFRSEFGLFFDCIFLFIRNEAYSNPKENKKGIKYKRRPESYNVYDAMNLKMELGLPAVGGCIDNVNFKVEGIPYCERILQAVSGQNHGQDDDKWFQWFEKNRNGRIPDRKWPATREGQIARLVWGELVAERSENGNIEFAALTRENPELANDVVLEALGSDNVLASFNAATVLTGLDDPAVVKKTLDILDKQPLIVQMRTLRRMHPYLRPEAVTFMKRKIKETAHPSFKAAYIGLLSRQQDASVVPLIVAELKSRPDDEHFKEVCLRALARFALGNAELAKSLEEIECHSSEAHFYKQLIGTLAGPVKDMKKMVQDIFNKLPGPSPSDDDASPGQQYGAPPLEGEARVRSTISWNQTLGLVARYGDKKIRKQIWETYVLRRADRLAATVIRLLDVSDLGKGINKQLEKWIATEGTNPVFRAACLRKLFELDPDLGCLHAYKLLSKSARNARKANDDDLFPHILMSVGYVGWRAEEKDLELLKTIGIKKEFHWIVRAAAVAQVCRDTRNFDEKWLIAVARGDHPATVRRTVIKALGLMRTERANEVLAGLVDHADPSVRFTAIYALEKSLGESHWCDVVTQAGKEDRRTVRDKYLELTRKRK